MSPNPHRAETRTGETTAVNIPSILLPRDGDTSSTFATFAVHPNDTNIAEITSQDGLTCTIRGLRLGSARIIITVNNQSATVIIAVSPNEDLYTLPATMVTRLGQAEFRDTWWTSNRPDNLPTDINNYNSEPMARLAWIWRNPGTNFGASGSPCGFDVLGYFVDPAVPDRRGWVRTTYDFGGWKYDLNGITNRMRNGVQVEGNVRLELKPEFVYDKGNPYLQITHILSNLGEEQLVNQRFGASADIMIYARDDAPLSPMPYGALMTNAHRANNVDYLPTMKLRLVCQNLHGITNVSTMWIGPYGNERNYVYVDLREEISDIDSALNFSYQDITLDPGESKSFVIRFTLIQ
jgi:hypothetical protein